MESQPTPFERLLHIERAVEQLLAAQLPDHARRALHETSPHAIWPSDEWLLTRLLRRSPVVLEAYQAPAELFDIEGEGLRLTHSQQPSPFVFAELLNGDAVVWITSNPPEWIWSSSSFRLIFSPIPEGHSGDCYTVQTLPLFKPIERGQSWKLSRRGELMAQTNLISEKAEQGQLMQRLTLLEKQNLQQRLKLESAIKELQVQLRVQQEQIDHLLKIKAS